MSNNVTPAVEGNTVQLGRETQSVGPKCEHTRGIWICITHREGFANNLQKDGHISTGDHVLAWGCAVHGPEVP